MFSKELGISDSAYTKRVGWPKTEVGHSVTDQTMWIYSLVVARQNVPITTIHSETTLS